MSRLGDADLHKIVRAHDQMYAFDAVLSAILISSDGGRTFAENFTPRGLVIDFEVDPADPKRLVASNENELFRSNDTGASWRPIDRREGIRLAWSAPGALYRALKDGTVERSTNGGDTWSAGRIGRRGAVEAKAISEDELYLALSDGTIMHTTDGAKTWTRCSGHDASRGARGRRPRSGSARPLTRAPERRRWRTSPRTPCR